MKVLLINKFLYPKGGDAISTLETGKLLSGKGHEVRYWGMEHPDNPEYRDRDLFVSCVNYDMTRGKVVQLRDALNILYSFEARNKLERLLQRWRPDIIHLNNFAHQISPSVVPLFQKYRIPSVMTMHDYKLVCASYSMLSYGRPCERCKGGKYYNCFLKKCTKGSFLKSLVNTIEMYIHHNMLHIYNNIDLYISPSIFLKDKVLEMGFKGNVVHLPNFVNTGSIEPSYTWNSRSIFYAGRLSPEKGLETLLNAVKGIDVNLKIIGDGSLKEALACKVKNEGINNVEFLGYKNSGDLQNEIKGSMFGILPSECYENSPLSVIETFALGKPVIGARIGGIPELIKDGETGLTFKAGNFSDLRGKIELMLQEKNISTMGRNARKFVEKELNPEKHYKNLMKIYEKALNKESK